MDYAKIYYSIINRAIWKEVTGQRYKGDGNYYEYHHIKPRSFDGVDDEKNLALLTSREHFLCHWLLVKIYEVDTPERRKMLKAWFMMAAKGTTGRPIINMNTYAKYRNEMSNILSYLQSGEKNSNFGNHWYTNMDDGSIKCFRNLPNSRWIRGMNLFRGENSSIPYMTYIKVSNTLKLKYKKDKNKIYHKNAGRPKTNHKMMIFYNVNDLTAKKFDVNNVPSDYRRTKTECKQYHDMLLARQLWDRFHSGNYTSLNDFSKELPFSQPALTEKLKKYIPMYNKVFKKRFDSNPNKELIGVYE